MYCIGFCRAGVVDGAVRRNPDWMLCYGKMLYDRGYDRGLYADALPVLEIAVRLCPTAEAVCDLGDCYGRRGVWKKRKSTTNFQPAWCRRASRRIAGCFRFIRKRRMRVPLSGKRNISLRCR